ncbi:MAG TPA: asparagine synthase (glutamine-hydrolyzing) [Cytophagaceae bacterium]|jgi:asparagine synthase (glutamine-hydrolysing)|nr:asparagine synthase (glutamine-hydrolyzing) [Cytophagaceae bacterium]
MCGIAGIVDYNKPIEEELLHRMNARIAHRGPDDSGTYIHQSVGLAHHRLSILDLSRNGHQPMISDCGNYVIIFNGEIYNHKEIRNKIAHKYSFKSHSDTETLLYGFIEYGEKLFGKLNGIFSFAVLDKKKEELLIVRDQLGVKPLYYYHKDQIFLFGSELKSLLEYREFDRSIDHNALVNYINFLWSPGEKTPFLYVKKLLPGHYIKLSTKTSTRFFVVQYYDIPFTGTYNQVPEEQQVFELQQYLEKAVERQLQSDVPVGFFLSGGLDSSAVLAMAKKLYPKERFPCYTIDSGDQAYEGFSSDLHYAKKVAKHLNVSLKVVKADIDVIRHFDQMIYHLDEPQADAAPLNVLEISKAALNDGVKVLLGGTGGDDLFSGYRRHQALNYEPLFKLVPRWSVDLLKMGFRPLGITNPAVRRMRKVLTDLDKTPFERMFGYYSWISLGINKSLFNEELNKNFDFQNYQPLDNFEKLWNNISSENSLLNRSLYWEMKTYLPDHNLNYTDKMSMAMGVETRVPFLDIEMVNFSANISPRYKMKGNVTKYILKKAMEPYLPKEIINRPKTGFGAPVRDWVVNKLDTKINDVLSPEAIRARGIFNPTSVSRLIQDNKSGKIDASYTIWSLLAIESWMRQFADR